MKRNKNQTWQQFDPNRKENNMAKEFIESNQPDVSWDVIKNRLVDAHWQQIEEKINEEPEMVEPIKTESSETVNFKPKVKKVKDLEAAE